MYRQIFRITVAKDTPLDFSELEKWGISQHTTRSTDGSVDLAVSGLCPDMEQLVHQWLLRKGYVVVGGVEVDPTEFFSHRAW